MKQEFAQAKGVDPAHLRLALDGGTLAGARVLAAAPVVFWQVSGTRAWTSLLF
jgi:hypothetical protein